MDFKATDLLKLPGEGEKTASGMVIKARTEQLEGDFSVMEGVIEPNELLAPHSHKHEAQMVYVLTGELEFEVGGENGLRFTAPAGSYVIKPRGVMHAFWNKKDIPANYIELSGKEYFEDFVDSTEKGTVYAYTHSETYGMTSSMQDTKRLMKEHQLTRLSGMELPKLSKLPDWIKELMNKN